MAERPVGIGEVSRLTGLSERQIRYYEKQGLVQPRRTAGRQRQYGPHEIARLRDIKSLLDRGQTLGVARAALGRARPSPPEDSDVRSRLMAGQTLRSLYPVSNRAELERMLTQRDEEDGR